MVEHPVGALVTHACSFVPSDFLESDSGVSTGREGQQVDGIGLQGPKGGAKRGPGRGLRTKSHFCGPHVKY